MGAELVEEGRRVLVVEEECQQLETHCWVVEVAWMVVQMFSLVVDEEGQMMEGQGVTQGE